MITFVNTFSAAAAVILRGAEKLWTNRFLEIGYQSNLDTKITVIHQ